MAQPNEVTSIDKVINMYKPHKQLVFRFEFEKVDSVKYGEQKLTINKTYLLDPDVRQLSKVPS
jgi:hypothetical protein